MMNTVINFLFKNSIALWRHIAKTQLLCDAQIYLYSVNKRQQHFNKIHKIKKNCDVSVTSSKQIIMSKYARKYLQYFYPIQSWSFQNMCNAIGWTRFFCATLYINGHNSSVFCVTIITRGALDRGALLTPAIPSPNSIR